MTIAPGVMATQGFQKLRFLIIDDFDNFRVSMRQILRSLSVDKVETASTGNVAIHLCTYEHFDVVLCDYNLGAGKNGQHILEELRHRKLLKRSSLFLMVTAETSKEMVMGAREYQPDAYLAKPVNRAMLESRLTSLIAQRSALLPINKELDLENIPEAISLCVKAIPIHPRYKSWLMKTLADLYIRVGDYAHARKIYHSVLAQRDISWAQLGKCKVLLAEQAYDEAKMELQDLITKHPDFMEAYDVLADTLTRDGKPSEAQRILEKATELSPNVLLRHKTLAELATSNQNIETAAAAWRRTVKLGAHSIHDGADHYLSLGRTLSEVSEGDLSDTGRSQADEAILALKKMTNRFPDIADIETQSLLIQARIHKGQNREKDAYECLAQAEASVEQDMMTADLGLELGKTLFHLDRPERAESLLNKLAQRFEADPVTVHKIENLLDEPVGFKEKLHARSLNRQGIRAFEAGSLDKAVEAFRKALTIVPSHTALNLNLVQVLMKQMSEGGAPPDTIKQCQQCLFALANLPTQHQQYRRYLELRKKLEAISHA
ncbi:MAG: tetratricopeptide repeat protein [Marinobacter sp.]|uniref:tetratricopeptide repeat protein n=1 Tax=Marinobacter sp. TaxID=50741 RepID=UPI0034A042C1